MTIDRYGLRLQPESGWEARVFTREPDTDGTVTRPVLHACTRALPAVRGDMGGAVWDLLGTEDVFVSLVEFGPESAGTGLFARQGRPPITPSSFDPSRLPKVIPGRSAAQFFFTEAGRAFCLYVVLGAHSRRMALAPRAERLVRGLTISRAPRRTLPGPAPAPAPAASPAPAGGGA